MRHGKLFEIARVTALAALLWAPGLGLVPALAAHGAPPGPDASDGGSGQMDPPPIVFLQEIWVLAWGADFQLNHSAMVLEEGNIPDVWTVQVYEDLDPIAEGVYAEIARLPVPHLSMDENGVTFQTFLSAGVIVGSTGFVSPTYGLTYHFEQTGGGDDIVVDSFTPLGLSADVGSAVDSIFEVAELMGSIEEAAAANMHIFTIGADDCNCDEIYNIKIAACAAAAIACELACTAVALAGIAACAATGPFAPVCIALVIVAHAACVAGCLANQVSCNLKAEADRLECEQECADNADNPVTR